MYTTVSRPADPIIAGALRDQSADANDGYAGPDRRQSLSGSTDWLAATFDEIDYGVLLLGVSCRVMHLNHSARTELDERHPLQLLEGALHARRARDEPALADALRAASERGLRKLLTLGDGAQRVSLSIVPLLQRPAGAARSATTLVMLGKRQVCMLLSMQGFARSHGLTTAETRVLMALSDGFRPGDTAAQLGVAISTVRTQIGNIRQKTGASSIRELLRQIALLPPLVGVLRAATPPVGDSAAQAEVFTA